MAYLLDTCVLSEFTKPKPSAAVGTWLATVSDTSQFVSVLTLGEIEKGVHRLPKSKRRTALERWFDEVRARVADRVLPIDQAVAREWGRIAARCELAGRPIPSVDGLLGATALVHGHTVITRTTSDILRSGAPIFDPWIQAPMR